MSRQLRTLYLLTICAVLVVCATTTHAQNPAVNINVDAAANRHAINPNIYGVAHASTAQLNDLNSPLNETAATTQVATTGS